MMSGHRALTDPDFAEVHRRWIRSDQRAVWRALTQLRLDQLVITRPLAALRRTGRAAASAKAPLLTHGPARPLVLDPPNYALGGLISQAWRISPRRRPVASLAEFVDFGQPGWAKTLVEFDVAPVNNGTLLTTTTRVYCTDDYARRRFAAYWLLIRIPSGLIRRDMLASVDRLTRVKGTIGHDR